MNFRLISLMIPLSIMLTSCSWFSRPEDVLKDYVNYRFQKEQTKEDLLTRTSGTLHLEILEMNEEDFKAFTDTKDLKFDKFKIIHKKCNDDVCYILYKLEFKTFEGDKEKFNTEIKKMAVMRLEDGRWKISDVKNIKYGLHSLEELK